MAEARTENTQRWVLIIFLALLFHAVLLALPWHLIFPPPQFPSQPMKIRQLSAEELAQLKNAQLKGKQFLLARDNILPSDTPPKDARYFSDRNRQVEREQKARNQVIAPERSASPSKPSVTGTSIPKLNQLGIPIEKMKPKLTSRGSDPSEAREGNIANQDQAIHDPTLPEGNENLLNTEQSIYYSYYARLYEAIGPVWQERINTIIYSQKVVPGTYQTLVDVAFDTQGNLSNIGFVQKSGLQDFDQAVVFAWQKIKRFPNPPKGLIRTDGKVHVGFSFTVEVSRSSQFQYSNPRRVY